MSSCVSRYISCVCHAFLKLCITAIPYSTYSVLSLQKQWWKWHSIINAVFFHWLQSLAECTKDTISHLTCCTVNASIFRMHTVINCSVGTVNQSALCVSTSDIIQEDGDSPLAIISTTTGDSIWSKRGSNLIQQDHSSYSIAVYNHSIYTPLHTYNIDYVLSITTTTSIIQLPHAVDIHYALYNSL